MRLYGRIKFSITSESGFASRSAGIQDITTIMCNIARPDPKYFSGEVKNPERTIPRAVFISGLVISGIYVLGTLSLLIALPASEINIISGFLQGIAAVGNLLGLGWMSNILALLITLGGIGGFLMFISVGVIIYRLESRKDD